MNSKQRRILELKEEHSELYKQITEAKAEQHNHNYLEQSLFAHTSLSKDTGEMTCYIEKEPELTSQNNLTFWDTGDKTREYIQRKSEKRLDNIDVRIEYEDAQLYIKQGKKTKEEVEADNLLIYNMEQELIAAYTKFLKDSNFPVRELYKRNHTKCKCGESHDSPFCAKCGYPNSNYEGFVAVYDGQYITTEEMFELHLTIDDVEVLDDTDAYLASKERVLNTILDDVLTHQYQHIKVTLKNND